MTIGEIIDSTKEVEQDIKGIKVAIQNQNKLTFFDNPEEIYFGELADIPEQYMDFEIIERSQICASSDESRNGAHVLLIKFCCIKGEC